MTAISTRIIEAGGIEWGRHMGAWGWGMALVGVLLMLLVVGLIVWLVAYSTRGQGGTTPSAKSALDLLDERYARGEIDRDEYLEKRSDLEP